MTEQLMDAEAQGSEAPAAGQLIFEPIPATLLRQVRTAMSDEAGNLLTVQADSAGGNPLRCCLRETTPGEEVLLIAYTPPGTSGAYAERGPVFIHARPCPGYPTPDEYPPGLRHRQQVVRAYDQQGRIADGILVSDGDQALTVIREVLDRPGVQLVHLRNVGYGCYNFAVRRA
ncbi:MAG TPA: DUF1203 domain-containing protein [Streptosporangiaceae bacterium]|nr:DUF1203 domain-containing protein [Streptosporangiaceae bacterium]